MKVKIIKKNLKDNVMQKCRNKKKRADDKSARTIDKDKNLQKSNTNRLHLLGLHIGVDGLDVVEVFEALHHLVDGLTLFGGDILEVVGDAGEFGTGDLEAVLLEMFLDGAEAGGVAIDGDAVLLLVLVELIVDTIVDEVENHLVHIQTILLLEGEDGLVVEEERERALGAQVAVELVEH